MTTYSSPVISALEEGREAISRALQLLESNTPEGMKEEYASIFGSDLLENGKTDMEWILKSLNFAIASRQRGERLCTPPVGVFQDSTTNSAEGV